MSMISPKFQSALYLYILLFTGLALVVPVEYVLELILFILFVLVFLGVLFYSSLLIATLREYPFSITDVPKGFFEPAVYVLIPAHNEESVIGRTASCILNQDYTNLKLFLINDNSTDGTLEIMESIKSRNPEKVEIVNVPPDRGKSKPKALNYALDLILKEYSHPDYIFILDADYLLSPRAIRTLVGILENAPKYVIGVQGNVRPRNWNRNFVTRFITLERLVGFNVAIEGDFKLNENGKYGGTVALLRFPYIIKLGKFTPDTVTEDTDLWVRALIEGYRFWYYHGVIGWEECVEAMHDYIKQRSRWAQGHLQVMVSYYWSVLKNCSTIGEAFIEHFYMMSYLLPVFWFLSVVLNGYMILINITPVYRNSWFYLLVSLMAFLYSGSLLHTPIGWRRGDTDLEFSGGLLHCIRFIS